jgi:hypothetical protein
VKAYIDARGASGSSFRFRLVEDPAHLQTMAGNFLYVRTTRSGFEVVYSGEAGSLTEALSRWAEAKAEHGATGLYMRLNISQATRLDEQADITAQYHPPMNGGETGPGPASA